MQLEVPVDIPEPALPTPPSSARGSYEPEGHSNSDAPTFSISAVFFPGVAHTPETPDLILVSSDSVFFYVHSHKILAISNTTFGSKWPQGTTQNPRPAVVLLEEPSPVVNLFLHLIYNLPYNQHFAAAEEIAQSVDALNKYGFSLQLLTQSWSELYKLMLERAHTHSIEMYALAAKYNLDNLAIAISPYVLSFELSELADEMVEKMGAVYLRRLMFLHLGRVQALKQLLEPLPEFHESTRTCGFSEQRQLTRAWSLAIASLAWDVRPDISPSTIKFNLNPLADTTSCTACKEGVFRAVKRLVSSWSKVKNTI